ncbi:MAG: tail fiber domain-containing protein [Saprospiraceae bacterium]|nr:tail fiber domain-containing protein [Saprospiraceae bacterium]
MNNYWYMGILILLPFLGASQEFEVEGDVKIRDNDPILRLSSNTNQSLGYLLGYSGGVTLGVFSGDLNFYTRVGPTSSLKMRVKDNGNVGIKTSDPLTKLHISGGVDASLSTHGYLMLGSRTSTNIIIDNNEIMARNNGQTSPLFLNHDGGAIYARGIRNIGDHKNMQFNSSTGEIGWDNSSRRSKINIETLWDDWSKIFDARPVKYCRPGSPERWEFGYIAEEMDSIGLSNLVGYDAEGVPDDFHYEKMVIYLTEIIKIHNSEIQSLKTKNEELERRLTQMNSLINVRKSTGDVPFESPQIRNPRSISLPSPDFN